MLFQRLQLSANACGVTRLREANFAASRWILQPFLPREPENKIVQQPADESRANNLESVLSEDHANDVNADDVNVADVDEWKMNDDDCLPG